MPSTASSEAANPPTLTMPLACPSREAGRSPRQVEADHRPGPAEPGGHDQHAEQPERRVPGHSSTTVQVVAIAATMRDTIVERCQGCRAM